MRGWVGLCSQMFQTWFKIHHLLFITPSHFIHFFGVCSYECTHRGWMSLSGSFSFAFHLFFFFYRQDRSPSLVLTDWHTDQLATEHQEIFLSLPLKWWNYRHTLPCQGFYMCARNLSSVLHACTASTWCKQSHLSSSQSNSIDPRWLCVSLLWKQD